MSTLIDRVTATCEERGLKLDLRGATKQELLELAEWLDAPEIRIGLVVTR